MINRIGYGYGSEWHLLRFMGRHRKQFNSTVLKGIGQGSHIDWLDFGFNNSKYYDVEPKGLHFLDKKTYSLVLDEWKNFWPQSGNPHNWDSIGWLYERDSLNKASELILLEAKANEAELKSKCGANPKSRAKIYKALDIVKNDLSIGKNFDWLNGYYQYANRIAVLWFLLSQKVTARLVFIYFYGDNNPSVNCPNTKSDWANSLNEQDKYLGLIKGHKLENYIHKIFIDIRK